MPPVMLLAHGSRFQSLAHSTHNKNAMQRDLRIDTLRGLLLVLITINHFGSWSSEGWWFLHFTWQPLGYVSAAEGFVFLSGFVFAIVYARHVEHPALLWRVARQRAFDIYVYHLTMILALAAAFLIVPIYRTMWKEWLSSYALTPFTSTLASTLLLHQPPYLDILPMYVVFVLLSPIALRLLSHREEGLFLTVSLALWFLGQSIHPGETITALLFPGHQPGHFNLLSWQLLYMLGLFFGNKYHRNESLPLLPCRPLMSVIFLCTLILFLSRHALVFPEIANGVDRASLGWLRVANCLLLVTTISISLQRLPLHVHVPWLTFLGQHSLPVFSFHVVILYLLTPITNLIVVLSGSLGLLSLMILVVFCLPLPALLHVKYKTWTTLLSKHAYSLG